jgi:hypothetical protein
MVRLIDVHRAVDPDIRRLASYSNLESMWFVVRYGVEEGTARGART